MIKKADVVLCLVAVAVMIMVITLITLCSPKGNSVVVTSCGETVGEYSLKGNTEIPVLSNLGYNIVVIENGEVYVKEADCRDQICVEHTPVSTDGEIIVCLPHKVTVEIR